MDSISIIIIVFLIVIFLLFLGILLYHFFGKIDGSSGPTDENELKLYYENLYNIPSPWKNDETVGKCNLYTFTSHDKYTPAKISITEIFDCVSSNTCSIADKTYCYDVDQILAIKHRHTCIGGNGQKCLTQNGDLVSSNYVEEYYQTCDTVKLCDGQLSLIAFNLNITTTGPNVLDSAVCISKEGNNLIQQKCDMSMEQDNVPTQLFRIERANYKDKKFEPNSSGTFARIITRPNNLIIEPNISENTFRFSKASEKEGFYWALIPGLTDPRYPTPQYKIPPQFVYIEDPNAFLKSQSEGEVSFWNYLTQTPKYSIQINSLKVGEQIVLGKLIYYNFLKTPLSINATNYLNYTLLPLLLKDISNYNL